jgi:hypothetical protein
VVVGDRKTQDIQHFTPLKKLLQRLGSYVVKKVSGVQVPDAVSGFRAYSREAALQLNIISPFSYTIEALIQSGKKHMAVSHVAVETNAKTRESRLFTSIPKFIERQLTTIVRMYTMYQPLRVFVLLGALITLIGLIPIVRFLIFYMMGDGNGHLQSLILGGVLTLLGIITFLIAILADLINFNRQLIEQTLEKVRRMELQMLDENKERESARNDTFE